MGGDRGDQSRRGRGGVGARCLEEDGEATSLGDLGYFANRQSALAFASRCATAFADDEPMPKPPCQIVHVTGASQVSLSEAAENAAPDERAASAVAA